MAVCENDELVLDAIFNPNLPTSPSNETTEEEENKLEHEQINPAVLNQVKELEIEGVREAEAGLLDKSLQIFNNAINLAPFYPATYNNRAQLYRMRGEIDAAKVDLDKAIELSKGHGKSASQAFTQRALLRKVDGDNEGAFEDFKKAACLGNTFAKQQVIQMNPYAALCNQMLSQAFSALKGEGDVEK